MTPPELAAAVAALAAGRPVLLLGDVEADGISQSGMVVVAGEHVDSALMAFIVRETSGVVCAAMTGARLDELRIPPIVASSAGGRAAAFAVSVDLRCGISTGISARDRAATVRALADPGSGPGDLVRPGHVLPVRTHDGGVLGLPGPAEAAVDLCRSAGLSPVAAIATVVDDGGDIAGIVDLTALAARYGLPLVRVSEIVAWRAGQRPVVRGAPVVLPTAHGRFTAVGYGDADGGEHLAVVRGDLSAPGPALVRVHTECVVGDVLGSLRCACGARLAAALAAIEQAGRGVLVYLRRQGMTGLDPVQVARGCRPASAHSLGFAAHVLRDLGIRGAEVLVDDPTESAALATHGVPVHGSRLLLYPAVAEVG